jgi:ribonuclease HI
LASTDWFSVYFSFTAIKLTKGPSFRPHPNPLPAGEGANLPPCGATATSRTFKSAFGAAIDTNIERASIKAVLSALNRAVQARWLDVMVLADAPVP